MDDEASVCLSEPVVTSETFDVKRTITLGTIVQNVPAVRRGEFTSDEDELAVPVYNSRTIESNNPFRSPLRDRKALERGNIYTYEGELRNL